MGSRRERGGQPARRFALAGLPGEGGVGLPGSAAARFRGRSSGRVLDTALWRHTRHPNYFGDACVWWGLFLLAGQSWGGALTILSPVLMTCLPAGRTGKPLMEQHMHGRPGNVARTSGFLPRSPRR
jgi:steroid 5-alpha reductase family enzyme